MNLNKIIKIPTREEFHRTYAGEIRIEDFCTSCFKKRRVPHYTPEERIQQSLGKMPPI